MFYRHVQELSTGTQQNTTGWLAVWSSNTNQPRKTVKQHSHVAATLRTACMLRALRTLLPQPVSGTTGGNNMKAAAWVMCVNVKTEETLCARVHACRCARYKCSTSTNTTCQGT